MLSKKIFVTVNFRSIGELNYYKKKYRYTKCFVSKKWGEETLSLPFHVKLTDKEIKKVSEEIKKFLEN